MKRRRLSKSSRKYILREKARIRREVLGLKEQERLIQELYQKFFKIPLVIKKEPSFAKASEGKKKIEQKTGQKINT